MSAGGDALTGAVVHWVPESASLGISVWSRPPICAGSGADARRLGRPDATTKPSLTRTRPP